MYLTIEGKQLQPKPGQSLLELIREAGFDSAALSARPLAAKIAGEVFTLNYIPLRHKDVRPDSPSLRRAMAASNGEVHLLRYSDPAGKECYLRTGQFVVFLAMRQLWPKARCKMNCTLGASVYFQVIGAEDFSVTVLKQKMQALVRQDIPLIRRRVPLQEAIDRYRADGQEDKARLLSWRPWDYFDEYGH